MSRETMIKKRPKYLNVFLLGLQLPFPGMMSIVHRVTGAGLFMMLWVPLWLFDKSLTSETDFQQLIDAIRHPIVLLICFGLLWAFIFHFFMGLRYLLLDADFATSLKWARLTSFAVAVVSSGVTALVFAGLLWVLFPEIKAWLSI